MIYLADRVLQTTSTEGTGALSLDSTATGFQSFVDGVGSGKKVAYHISDDVDWESGSGTITAGTPDILTRDTVYESSNSGALVNWAAGTRNVRLAPLAKLSPFRDENLNFVDGFGAATGSASAHTVTLPLPPIGYSDGMEICYIAPAANTGAITTNVNGLGAKAIKVNGQDPAEGAIAADHPVLLRYVASEGWFECLNAIPILTGRYLGTVVIASTDTFEKADWPAGRLARVRGKGAGGGGGGADAANGTSECGGGGGGEGGEVTKDILFSALSTSETVTIGAGGTAGDGATGSNGGNGGDTTFGSHFTAGGGRGGNGTGAAGSAIGQLGGLGGTATGGDRNIPGATGGFGLGNTASNMGMGGTGAGRGGGRGGRADLGSNTHAATAGTSPGAGGGGGADVSTTGASGGAGAAGECVVEIYS